MTVTGSYRNLLKMRYVRRLTSAIFLGVASFGAAEAPDYILAEIKSHTTEDVLPSLVWVGVDCPFDIPAALEIVDGVFIRSRVKKEADEDGDLYLSVSLYCLLDGTRHIYNLKVVLKMWILEGPWILDWYWGSYGAGREEYIKAALKTSVENALTDFIRAHMD